MKIVTQTDRFFLREIAPEDEHGLYELDSDPDVHRYLGGKPINTIKQARDLIQFIRQQYADNGIGRWAIIDKQTGEFIGWTGLKLVTEQINDHIQYYDLGYRLIKKYWGKGIATETALASLDYGFKELEAPAIYGMADCDNAGSNQVLQKAGLQLIETFDYNGVQHNWYKITREEWRSYKTKATKH